MFAFALCVFSVVAEPIPYPQFTPLPVFVAAKPNTVLRVPVTAIIAPTKVAVKATEETVEWVSECAGGVCRMVPRVVKKTEAKAEAVLPPLPPRPRRWLIRPWR